MSESRVHSGSFKQARIVFLWFIAVSMIACGQREDSAEVIETSTETRAPAILVVTPTSVPTRVPTAVRIEPTAIPTATEPPTETADDAASRLSSDDCEAALEDLYTSAGDLCLTGPTGYFCSGGSAPIVEPASDRLNAPGSLAEAVSLDSVGSAAIGVGKSGGLVWLRLEENILLDALLIGKVSIRNAVPAGSEFAKWQSFEIESGTVEPTCENAPGAGAMILQGLYGQSARLAINGVSVEINGTVIVLTQGQLTKFIAIEGQIHLRSYGQLITLNVGEQLNLGYPPGEWSKPLAAPARSSLLEYDLIKDLPIVLFDRPVPIPQPGYAQTQGGVNMRIAPDINAQLLFQVPAGETMAVLGISSDSEWLHIRLGNGETGWMSAALLAKNLGNISNVYDITPEPPQRYGKLATRAIVNVAAGGNLREAPDTAFRIKRTLPYGTEVELRARSPYSPWVKVDAGGDVGWMALFTLRTESVIGSLPIDYNVPLPPRATSTPSFSYGGGHAYPDPATGY